MLDHWLMDTPAWLDLDPVSRCTYIEVKRRYFGKNNGQIVAGVRELAECLKVSKDTVARALLNLEAHGFIVTMQKGSFNRKVRHATEYRLTEKGCDVTGALATKEFARWRKNTVPVVRPTVPVVRPIGPSGETEPHPKPAQNPLHGPSGETVTQSIGPCGETHICLPSQCRSAFASSAVDVASAAESSASPRAAKLEPIRKPSPTHERRTKPKAA